MYYFDMNRKQLKTKLINSKLFSGESTINSLLSGRRYPSFSKALKLEKDFNIPIEAWKDIKSYINESITSQQLQIDSTIQGQGNEQ